MDPDNALTPADMLDLGIVQVACTGSRLHLDISAAGLTLDLDEIDWREIEILVYADRLVFDGRQGHPSHFTLALTGERQAREVVVFLRAHGLAIDDRTATVAPVV